MGFNIPTSDATTDKVSTAILNQINVDEINVKVLPAGTSPNVVYRIGDGTVHPEGWNNVIGEQYLDFYVSTGAQGIQGEKGEDGQSAYTQAVAGGYTGTQAEFYTLLSEVAANAVSADADATAAAASASAAATSESNAATSETNASASATTAGTHATNAATSETNAATSASNASTSETNAANSATSASSSATSASASATTATTQADLAAASYDLFDDRFLGSKGADPLVDNDGDPLLVGAMYWNATSNEIRVYSGSVWSPITVAQILDGLTDVTITSPVDAQALVYDQASGKWINGTPVSTQLEAPALAAGTEVTEGVKLDIAITNYDANNTYTITPTGCTVTNNAGTLEITNPTVVNPSFTIQASLAGWTGEDSQIVTRNLTVKLATPTLPTPPADEAVDTNITYTYTVSDNSDKLVFNPSTTTFILVSATGGTGTKVGDTIEVTGITGTSVGITMQYSATGTYSNVTAISSDTGGNYATSAASTADEIVISTAYVADDAITDDLTTDVLNDGF